MDYARLRQVRVNGNNPQGSGILKGWVNSEGVGEFYRAYLGPSVAPA